MRRQEKEIVVCLLGGKGIEKTGEGGCIMFRRMELNSQEKEIV